MVNTFELVGKLSIGKESERFKPYKVDNYDSGYTKNKLLFNAIAGSNRHMLEISGFYQTDGKGKIYTFTKGGINPDTGEKIKGEKKTVSWNDRKNKDILVEIAEFKKFVIDLEEPNRRYKLKKAIEQVEDGSISEEDVAELLSGEESLEIALENSDKKRFEFMAESDYAEILNKIISSEKYKDRMFKIRGNVEYTEYNGKTYKHLIPTRIYLAEKDAQPESIANLTMFFTKKAVVESGNDILIDGYLRNYDSKLKGDLSTRESLTLDNNTEDENKLKLNKLIQKIFTTKGKEYYELGVKCKMLNGSQKMEITTDMLTPMQQELLELGATTLDELRKELGGEIYGDKIEAYVIEGISKGYTSGAKPTVYKEDDFIIPEVEVKEVKATTKEEDAEDDDLGLNELLG